MKVLSLPPWSAPVPGLGSGDLDVISFFGERNARVLIVFDERKRAAGPSREIVGRAWCEIKEGTGIIPVATA